jgi:cytochrome c oxidase subunit 4
MASAHSDKSLYIKIFWWLFVLTIAEIAAVFMPIAKLAINMALVLLALVKASLVAMYFMHLRLERRTLALVALTPLLLGALLIFALLPDLTAVPNKSAPVAQLSEASH